MTDVVTAAAGMLAEAVGGTPRVRGPRPRRARARRPRLHGRAARRLMLDRARAATSRTHIAAREDELAALLQRLVGFDSVESGGQFAALQGHLAELLGEHGAQIALGEPDPALVAGHPYVPEGFDFAGQPQLVARFPGAGGGRTLLTCGHVDVVSADPRDAWTTDPFGGERRDGLVFGRGSCDMKGGVAAMAFAASCSPARRPPPRRPARQHGQRGGDDRRRRPRQRPHARGRRGDRARAERARRLDRVPRLAAVHDRRRGPRRPRRPAAARIPDAGGAVSAIDKAVLLLDALRRLNEEWALRPRHPHLSPAHAVVTAIHGGEWMVSYPARCRIEVHIEYLPGQTGVEAEVEDWLARAAAADPWLRAHPPVVSWLLGGVPPSEIARRRADRGRAARRASATSAARRGSAGWRTGATRRRSSSRPGSRRSTTGRATSPAAHGRRARAGRRARRLRPGHRDRRDALLRRRSA